MLKISVTRSCGSFHFALGHRFSGVCEGGLIFITTRKVIGLSHSHFHECRVALPRGHTNCGGFITPMAKAMCVCSFLSFKIFSALIYNMVNPDRHKQEFLGFSVILRVKTDSEAITLDTHD